MAVAVALVLAAGCEVPDTRVPGAPSPTVVEPGTLAPTPAEAKYGGDKALVLALRDKGGGGFLEEVDWSEIEDAEWVTWGKCGYDPEGWFLQPVSAVEVKMPKGRRVVIYVPGYDVC